MSAVHDNPVSSPGPITVRDLHELLVGRGELALLDVREPVVTGTEGTILLAVSVPLGRLELVIDSLVPRRSTPVVVFDGGTGDLAERAARRLGQLGFTDVRPLAGGVRAWRDAGYKVHVGGTHVLGQAFGEFLEDAYATPHISVADLREKLAAGEDVVLVDSRPLPEFVVHSLPGATSVPGAELVYRTAGLLSSPDSLVVVNCAGRTRSIVGAQALRNAGLPNPVVALQGGTMSWLLEGLELEHGRTTTAPPPTGHVLAEASAAAGRIATRFGVQTVGVADLERFEAEAAAGTRSLYLLDVRGPDEYECGHLPGARSVPSWEVSPWIFRHVATRNARLVLVDGPDLVRATVSASWLVQIGWGEVFVLDGTGVGRPLVDGPDSPTVARGPDDAVPDAMTPAALAAAISASQDVAIVDVDLSTRYRVGHLPGAWFALRSRLDSAVGSIPGLGTIVVTSEDGVLAGLAAAELAGLTDRRVEALAGGTAAWEAAGYEVERGSVRLLDEPDDVAHSAWAETDPDAQKEGFRRYLRWEVGLVDELRADDTVPFVTVG